MSSGNPFALSTLGGPLGSSSLNALQSRQIQSVTKPVLDLPAMQSASRVLQDQFIKDAQVIPDLTDTLNTRKNMVPLANYLVETHSFSAAGQSSASYSVSPEDYLVPFSKRRHINIPEGLWQHYNS